MEDLSFNRILFSEGNPWPQGHEIESLHLDGRIFPRGLFKQPEFHVSLHLSSVDYRMNDGGEFVDDYEETEDKSSWQSKTVWNNYHSCSINGLLHKGTKSCPMDLLKLQESRWHIDPLPESLASANDDALNFNIYLLGHDDIADNHIEIGKLHGETYPITWSAKIALAYSGNYNFEYSFTTKADLKRMEHIFFPRHWNEKKAQKHLSELLVDHELYQIGEAYDQPAFILKNQ